MAKLQRPRDTSPFTASNGFMVDSLRSMRRTLRLLVSVGLLALASGCATLEALDQALYEIVPTHPVTGAPVANIVSTESEVRSAAQQHARIEGAVRQVGLQLDPPGVHLDQMIRVLQRVGPVATAHRPGLPWQYWLIPDRSVNAFTTGGGFVYFYDGLWGGRGLIREGDDDEFAFVLAHEMAHVNLLHVSLRQTQALFTDRIEDDAFYSASFTTEQEAEADRLAVLYATLAGYDPEAGARIWDRTGVTEADFSYLNSHPVGADRARRVRDAIAAVAIHRTPGRIHPEWRARLADNVLFPRVAARSGSAPTPGAGIARAIAVGLETKIEHEAAKEEAERREKAATRLPEYQSRRVKLLAVQNGTSPLGQPVIQLQFQNGSIYDIRALGVRVRYLNGSTEIAQDPNCGGPAQIPAGQTVWLACTRYDVPGAAQYQVEITGVEFR